MSQSPDGCQRQWVLDALGEHEGRLTRYAERLTHDHETARDVVQYAFLRLCDTERESIHNVVQWLYAVCRNRAIDLLRKGKRMQPLDTENELYARRDPPPEESAETADTCAFLRGILATLPAVQQECVDLWAEGFSYREISDITSRTEGNVRVIVHRAFKALREHPMARQLVEAGSEA